MKIKSFSLLIGLSILNFLSVSRADDFNAVQSGNWSDPATWVDNTVATNGTVPGPNDDADIPSGFNVTVDTNVVVEYIYDYGTVTMAPNSSLNLLQDAAIATSITLDATAIGNTVIYSANPFFAYQTNYYNFELIQTNYVNPLPPYGSPWQYFNNFSSSAGPTPMTIAGNMTLIGAVEVQQGTDSPGVSSDISIGGNLIIGTGCAWDTSGANLTVAGDTFIYGSLQDLNGALGSNYFGGNVIVVGPSNSLQTYAGSGIYTNGWYVSDVTTWGIGGNLTNDGSIFGQGYGSISFDRMGAIAGSNVLTIPTIAINGNYSIDDTIVLTTNTPTLNGTLVFDIARTNQIILRYAPSLTTTNTTMTNYYGGDLIVINSGAAPTSGKSYQLFSASNYAGAFGSISLPTLPAGLSWIDSLATNGSITVTGTAVGGSSPILTLSRSGNVLTLSWDSTTFPGYSVQGQTNSAGLRSNWSATGSGTISPFTVTISPSNPPVFFRLSNP
ncbi:MAG TPA: hypothetical protein VIK59_07005 [Verrucomicrobiae bacterium]